jgi:hypothetical protein
MNFRLPPITYVKMERRGNEDFPVRIGVELFKSFRQCGKVLPYLYANANFT